MLLSYFFLFQTKNEISSIYLCPVSSDYYRKSFTHKLLFPLSKILIIWPFIFYNDCYYCLVLTYFSRFLNENINKNDNDNNNKNQHQNSHQRPKQNDSNAQEENECVLMNKVMNSKNIKKK